MMVCDRVTRSCWRRVEEGDVVWGGGSIRVTRERRQEKKDGTFLSIPLPLGYKIQSGRCRIQMPIVSHTNFIQGPWA